MKLILTALLFFPFSTFAQWVQESDFPGTARDDASIFHSMDYVYVGCGRDVNFGLMTDWYRLDMEANPVSWSPIASLPATGRQYCTTFQQYNIADRFFLLFGGQDANGALNEMWAYDRWNDSWNQLPSMPGAPRSAASGFMQYWTDEYHVVGGILDNGTAIAEHWVFNLNSLTWTQLADFPGAARHRASSSGYVGTYWTNWNNLNGDPQKAILAGGADANFNALADAWMYDPNAATSWTQIGDLPAARYGMASAPRGIFAGGISNDSTYHDDIYYLNTTQWQTIDFQQPSIPQSRKGAILASTKENIFFGLGIDDSSTRHNDLYAYSSAFTSITEQESESFEVFPNPAISEIQLPLSGYLTIHDASGRLLYSEENEGVFSVDVSALSNGSYYAKMLSNGKQLYTRFVVSK